MHCDCFQAGAPNRLNEPRMMPTGMADPNRRASGRHSACSGALMPHGRGALTFLSTRRDVRLLCQG